MRLAAAVAQVVEVPEVAAALPVGVEDLAAAQVGLAVAAVVLGAAGELGMAAAVDPVVAVSRGAAVVAVRGEAREVDRVARGVDALVVETIREGVGAVVPVEAREATTAVARGDLAAAEPGARLAAVGPALRVDMAPARHPPQRRKNQRPEQPPPMPARVPD